MVRKKQNNFLSLICSNKAVMCSNFNNFQVKCPSPVTVLGGLCHGTIERTWPGSVDMETRICTECGGIFANTNEYFYKSGNGKLKSKCKKCLIKIHHEKMKFKLRLKKCLVCSKEFKPYTTLDKYCSASCRIENMKSKRDPRRRWNEKSLENRRGKKNPAYRNGQYVRGKKRRVKGEHEYLKNIGEMKGKMIEETGYLFCQNCGTSNSVKFEGHHIIYRSEKPLHECLHKKYNLIITCIKCHNEFHKHKHTRNELVQDRGLDKVFGNDVLNK